MSRPAPVETDPPKIELTPMIDVVFLLITLFVLVTEMAAAEFEVLQLPDATECSHVRRIFQTGAEHGVWRLELATVEFPSGNR